MNAVPSGTMRWYRLVLHFLHEILYYDGKNGVWNVFTLEWLALFAMPSHYTIRGSIIYIDHLLSLGHKTSVLAQNTPTPWILHYLFKGTGCKKGHKLTLKKFDHHRSQAPTLRFISTLISAVTILSILEVVWKGVSEDRIPPDDGIPNLWMEDRQRSLVYNNLISVLNWDILSEILIF